jgi:hypothetical protein
MERIVLDYNPRKNSFEVGELGDIETTIKEGLQVKSYAHGRIVVTFPKAEPTDEQVAAYLARKEEEAKPKKMSKKVK